MILYEAKWTAASRKAHKAAGGYFAGPNDTFPLKDASDVSDAWGLAGHADNPDQVRANIKRWAKDNGHYDALPDTAKAETTESVDTFNLGVIAVSNGSQISLESVDAGQRPQKKIGTLKISWLEYNARSLNGRIYPKATCDAIYRAAQEVLSNPDAMPPTTFISHEAANGNVNVELVGAPVKVWQEGNKFWANIDLADTRVARDMLALAEGKYLKSGSMRVAGVELMHDHNYDVPLVVCQEGITPQFLGIDLTTRPGLADSARITQVLYESAGQQSVCIESFDFNDVSIESKVEEVNPPAMTIPLYLQIIAGVLQEAKSSREAHTAIHDHLAGVMDEVFGPKHGSESVHYKALIEGQFDEAGKAIAQKHAARLAAAHDESAKQLGMKCEGCYKEAFAPSDTDQDGDNPDAGNDPDNDGESQKGTTTLTLTQEQIQEALKLAAEQGYQVTPPLTEAEKKLAALEAQIAEQAAKLAQLQEQAPIGQRQTQTESQLEEQNRFTPEPMYQEGDYLQGDLAPKNWKALANRRVAWPKDVNPRQALHELAPLFTYRLLETEAVARGMDVATAHRIGPNEDI